MSRPSQNFLRGKRIAPPPITGRETAADLIDQVFLAYNAGRLREACQLFNERMLEPNVTVAMSLTGAMTPAGLGMSTLIPLMQAGFVDWIISTGANLYHDAHFALGLAMHQGTPFAERRRAARERRRPHLRHFLRLQRPAVHRWLHSRGLGARRVPEVHEHRRVSLPARRVHAGAGKGASARGTARCSRRRHELEVPIYTSSPGDSSIGMNVAELALSGQQDPVRRERGRQRDRVDRARGQA